MVNTNKWNSKSQNLTPVLFQRRFLLQKEQDFVQKKSEINNNLKRQKVSHPDSKIRSKIFSSFYYRACILITFKVFFYFIF